MVSIFGILEYHTHMYTKDNRDIAISTSDIYDILFNVKEVQFLLEMLSRKTHEN